MQIAIGSRKHATVQLSCLRFRLTFLDLLAAVLSQPAWRAEPQNAADKCAIVELLVKFLTHPSEPLADAVCAIVACAICLWPRDGFFRMHICFIWRANNVNCRSAW
jgi:hypothetical protein